MGRILTIFDKILNAMKAEKKDATKEVAPKKAPKKAKSATPTVKLYDFKAEVLSEARAIMVRRGRSSINIADLEQVLDDLFKKMNSY